MPWWPKCPRTRKARRAQAAATTTCTNETAACGFAMARPQAAFSILGFLFRFLRFFGPNHTHSRQFGVVADLPALFQHFLADAVEAIRVVPIAPNNESDQHH